LLTIADRGQENVTVNTQENEKEFVRIIVMISAAGDRFLMCTTKKWSSEACERGMKSALEKYITAGTLNVTNQASS
jgi:hypothetical protein